LGLIRELAGIGFILCWD